MKISKLIYQNKLRLRIISSKFRLKFGSILFDLKLRLKYYLGKSNF